MVANCVLKLFECYDVIALALIFAFLFVKISFVYCVRNCDPENLHPVA